MISPVLAARSEIERLTLSAICGLACLATVLIAITPQWPLLLIEAGIVAIFIVAFAQLRQFSLNPASAITASCMFGVPFVGAIQIICNTTAYRYATILTMVQ